MKQAIADVINYIDGLPVFHQNTFATKNIRQKLQSILSKSDDKEDVEFVYVPVSALEKPTTEGWYFVLYTDNPYWTGIVYWTGEKWLNYKQLDFNTWLKKVPANKLNKEVIGNNDGVAGGETIEDDFEPCSNCDMPDACADFRCAIKKGIRKDYPIDGVF